VDVGRQLQNLGVSNQTLSRRRIPHRLRTAGSERAADGRDRVLVDKMRMTRRAAQAEKNCRTREIPAAYNSVTRKIVKVGGCFGF